MTVVFPNSASLMSKMVMKILTSPKNNPRSWILISGLIAMAFCPFYLFHNTMPLYHIIWNREKAIFIDKALLTGFPDDHFAIRNLCSSRNWTDNVIFSCNPPQDDTVGAVIIRNVVLNCVRYAIETGGMHFPKLTSMRTNNLQAPS